MKAINILLSGMLVCGATLLFDSCQEEGLGVNSNDVSYISFNKKMTTDTTRVCFQFYGLEEGSDVKVAQVPIEVSICGKVQDEDLEFTLSIDTAISTLPESQCVLPEKCVFKQGQLLDTIYVKLKNSEALAKKIQLIALRINAEGEVREGITIHSRAIIAVTDRLFKPDWWALLDIYDGTYSSVESYYLGVYSDKKYLMFLEELQKDNVVFDGTDKQVLRKYALRLKYTLKRLKEEGNPVLVEGVEITVPVGG